MRWYWIPLMRDEWLHQSRPGLASITIDYHEDNGLLYAAAAEAAQLTVARIDDNRKPNPVAVEPTAKGLRSVAVGPSGCAYLIDPLGGRMLKVELQ